MADRCDWQVNTKVGCDVRQPSRSVTPFRGSPELPRWPSPGIFGVTLEAIVESPVAGPPV